jgi:hypothetical protein
VVTCTLPLAFLWLETAAASFKLIFWMMADLLRPVPAAGAPAFCTKNTSSVGGYLSHTGPVSRASLHDQRQPHQVTASWYSGSDAEDARTVNVGLSPMTA